MQLTVTDNHFLGTLPPDVRTDVEQWRDALLAVTKPIQKSLEAVARRFDVSLKTARRKYDEFRHSGWDIRVLVNRARVPDAESAITPEFVEWMKALVENNQRKTSPSLRVFKKKWRAGETIPGMDNALPRHQLPAGFSDDNIRRAVRDAFATAAARRGLSYAVSKFGPQIFSTRASLWYGSHLMLDDMWHDNFVVYGTKKKHQLVRVLELDALDVFSGYLEDFGCKPRLQRDDGTFDGLKEKYARLLLAKIHYQRGYSPRGGWILAEHGTAAVSERVARILFDRTGGLIRLRESGITGEEQAIIGWRGQGKGNPQFKAALESLRNLKHNELGAIPAQTGKDRDSRPEYTHGLLTQADEELKVLEVLARKNPALAAQFRLRVWDYHSQFGPFLMQAYKELNHRDWHSLEGWERIPGNIMVEYRTTPDAPHFLTNEQFLALPAVSQDLLISAAAHDPRYLNRRRLSPADVRARDCRDMIQLPAWVVCEILADDFLFEDLKVEGAYFREFRDQERLPDVADGETFLFESVITKEDGSREQLRDDKYSGFVNPFDLDQLFVCDARKRCLGIAAREQMIDRADDEALKRAYGQKAHRIAELKKPMLARHAESIREETARLDHNANLLDAQQIEERSKTRAARDAFMSVD